MKRTVIALLFVTAWLGLSALRQVDARLQYKTVITKMEAETDAEKGLQAKVKADGCNYCHDKKNRKIRTAAGKKLHLALGRGDTDTYKYDKAAWKKVDGQYPATSIKMVRDAINWKPKK